MAARRSPSASGRPPRPASKRSPVKPPASPVADDSSASSDSRISAAPTVSLDRTRDAR